MDEDDGDYVNLTGVFIRAQVDEPGVRLDKVCPDWARLRTVVIDGLYSKFLAKGAWYCRNSKCDLHWAMVEGECTFILNNETSSTHYCERYECVACGRDCNMATVVVYAIYLSQKGFDDLRIRMRWQATCVGSNFRAVAEVHVLANTGTKQLVSSSPYPGRVLGPDGEFAKWFYPPDEVIKE